MKKKQRQIRPTDPLKMINVNAAGLDIGSEEILACVPADRDQNFVQTFKTFTSELYALRDWLKNCRITSVAMEATGIYWIPIYEILESSGFEVLLVNPKELKRRKKSDVLDCQWIQQLHSYGLLAGAFRPNEQITELRAFVRHRENLIQDRSAQIQRMQKALHLMNIQLDNVLRDITGETGMKILRGIVSGNHDPEALSKYRNFRCKNSQKVIQKSLEGNYRSEYLFQLKQCLEYYDFLTSKLLDCDFEIEKRYRNLFPELKQSLPGLNPDMYLIQAFGVDLTKVDGLSTITVQMIFSELGSDWSKFPTEKKFVSWLRLCPNNKISGGKILSKKTEKTINRAAQAMFYAAGAVKRSDTALGRYYRRVKTHLGPMKAHIATAHKIARILYHMITNKVEYDETILQKNDKRYNEKLLKNIGKRANQLGFQLVPMESVS